MKEYYTTKCKEYSKEIWQVINNIIGKTKHTSRVIPYITIDGVKTYDAKKIADEFGSFHGKMGANLAKKILESKKSVHEYISKIPQTLNILVVSHVGYIKIENIIKALPAKSSSGHDKLSNIVLKHLSEAVLYLLLVVFNQSLSSGIFPEKMKIVEIVPLYKGKREDMVINYHPVSLLMTISKVLEKIMYKRMYSFLTRINIFFDSQYGFRSKRFCEHAIMEMVGHLLQAKNDGKHSIGAFLDLSKAFDMLDHSVLI